MPRNPTHEMLVKPIHDEAARQQYVLSLKDFVRDTMRANNRKIYDVLAKPSFVAEHGREPEDRFEVAEVMWNLPWYCLFSRFYRDAQEMMWDSVADSLYRERNKLSEKFRKYESDPNKKGSLDLNPQFDPPRGMSKMDIHLQPGGFCMDLGDDDVLAGAFYEYGGNLFTMGRGVGQRESKGEVATRFINERYPDLEPKRILDIGCSAGSSTVPFACAFPEAEVHGIDVGPAILRYAHARAEAMGAAVHFHQRLAEATGFADDSFDVVVSCDAMHEMPQKTTEGMMRESFRLLRPGGVAVHMDVPLRFKEYDAWTQFNRVWDQVHNNEPYWTIYAYNNPTAMLVDAGFPADMVWEGRFLQLDKSVNWFLATARKPE